MTHGVARRHRQPALAHGDVEVAARHRQWPHQRLFGRRYLRIGNLLPAVASGLFEHELLHA